MSTGPSLSKARSAVLWNVGWNIFRDILQFVQMLVLTRLLAEDSYGEFAFVTSITGVLAVFSAASFLSYTLQVKSDAETHYQDQFTAASVIQVGAFVITNLIAIAIGYIPQYAATQPLIHAASFTFLLEWTCELRRKMIERDCDFRSLRLLHGVGLIANVICAIVMGFAGFGPYSLVVPGMLTTIPFIWDLFYRQRWRPTWEFSWEKYKPAFFFGLTRIGSSVAAQARPMLEASYLVAAIGFGPLGILNRAHGLAMLACGKVAPQLMFAIYPVLTRLDESDNRVERAGNLILRLLAWATIPVAVLLSIVAEPAVITLYGSRWSEVSPLLKFTLVIATLRSLANAVSTLLLARGRAKLCVLFDFVNLGVTALALYCVLPYGLAIFLISMICLQAVNYLALVLILITAGGASFLGFVQSTVPPLVGSTIGIGLSILASRITGFQSETIQEAIVISGAFSIGYLLSLRLAFQNDLSELISVFPAKNAFRKALLLPAI